MEKIYKMEGGKRVQLSQAELAEYRQRQADAEKAKPKEDALNEIIRLESLITARRLREAILSQEGKDFIADIEVKIQEQRNIISGE